jgi:hypothetical protein
MSLRLNVWSGGLGALLVWACAKANDSDLVGHRPVPVAGSAGRFSTGGTGGTGGTTGGSSGKGGAAGKGGAGGTFTGGTAGSGGSAGSGRAGAPACGEATDAGLVVHYLAQNTQDSTNQVHFNLYFENNSNEAIDLSRVAVRYWMTAEPAAFNPPVTDYRASLVIGEHAEYVSDGKNSHLLITFTGDDIPPMNPDLNLTEVQFRVLAQNDGRFDQTNDYSFAPTSQTKTPNDHVTAYVDGRLAWGREPSGVCPGMGEGGQGGQGGEGGEAGTGGSNAGQGGEGGA